MAVKLLRRREVSSETGFSQSLVKKHIREGLFVPGIPLGPRLRAWPSNEVEALNLARVRGASDDEIRALVKELVAQRARAAA